MFTFSLCFAKVARDPRFDDLSGEYNPEVFDKTYQFLNDIRAKEKQVCSMRLVYLHLEGRNGRGGAMARRAEGAGTAVGGQQVFGIYFAPEFCGRG